MTVKARRFFFFFLHSLSVANITVSATEETACPEMSAKQQPARLASPRMSRVSSGARNPDLSMTLVTATPNLSTRYRYHSARTRALWHPKYRGSAFRHGNQSHKHNIHSSLFRERTSQPDMD